MKRAAVALLVAAAVVGAALVALRGSGESAQAAVRHAAETTAATGSSRFVLRLSPPEGVTLELAGQDFEQTEGHGLMDYVHQRGRFTSGSMELLLDGDVTYMRAPMMLEGGRWLRVEQEADPLDLGDRAMRNPVGLLEFLTGVGADVQEVGDASVRGVTTRHYEGTLDLQKVVDAAPPARREELRETLDVLAEMDDPTAVPFGLWVDEEGRTRRLRIDSDYGMSFTVEYYDFGVPVELDLPGADEVVTMAKFNKEIQKKSATCMSDTFGDPETGGGSVDTWTQYAPDPDDTGGNGGAVNQFCGFVVTEPLESANGP